MQWYSRFCLASRVSKSHGSEGSDLKTAGKIYRSAEELQYTPPNLLQILRPVHLFWIVLNHCRTPMQTKFAMWAWSDLILNAWMPLLSCLLLNNQPPMRDRAMHCFVSWISHSIKTLCRTHHSAFAHTIIWLVSDLVVQYLQQMNNYSTHYSLYYVVLTFEGKVDT